MTYRVKASPYFVNDGNGEGGRGARGSKNKSDMVMILPEKMERDAGEVEGSTTGIALDGTHTLTPKAICLPGANAAI